MSTKQGVRPPSPEEAERFAALAEEVRRASQEARLLPLDAAGAEFDVEEPGRLAELLTAAAWEGDLAERRPADLSLVTEGGRSYLYSVTFMTPQYAGTAARVAAGDHRRIISAAVRFDSETYPRPTLVDSFAWEPFYLTKNEIEAALRQMGEDPAYADIEFIKASDGTQYLFSRARLAPDWARALAEYEAVEKFKSP